MASGPSEWWPQSTLTVPSAAIDETVSAGAQPPSCASAGAFASVDATSRCCGAKSPPGSRTVAITPDPGAADASTIVPVSSDPSCQPAASKSPNQDVTAAREHSARRREVPGTIPSAHVHVLALVPRREAAAILELRKPDGLRAARHGEAVPARG